MQDMYIPKNTRCVHGQLQQTKMFKNMKWWVEVVCTCMALLL